MGEAADAREDIFSHLEELEAGAHKVALKRGAARTRQEDVAWMKARVQELRRQRDELRAKVNMCRSLHVGSKEAIQSDLQTSQGTKASRQALLEWKIENAKGLLQVFRLTGLSGKLTKRGACLCISTAFEGTYLGAYYLDLLIQQPIQIQRHSVPSFIPLEQIAREHLQTDIRRFLSMLSEHLNAYDGRKFQVDQLQERFSAFLEGDVRGNSLYNLLEFNYGVRGGSRTFPFTARLTYGDPVSALPTEATVVCKEDAPSSSAEVAAAHSALFPTKPLHEIFSAITASTETLSNSVL
uniref:Centromere protein O n=2 Tax=Pogona vitticeps TaxID=103695 RepID=A0ABM5FAS1_9SAUR